MTVTTGIKQRYAVEDLTVGMFVASLDCPMSKTPFPLGGFYIRTKEQIIELSQHCSFVMVNLTKSKFVQDFSNTMQLEVLDIPKALTDPKGFRLHQKSRKPQQGKPRGKGRVKRLLALLAFSAAILHYLPQYLPV